MDIGDAMSKDMGELLQGDLITLALDALSKAGHPESNWWIR